MIFYFFLFLLSFLIPIFAYPPVVISNTKIINLESNNSQELYTIKLLIPQSYYTSEKKYPVIYLSDGDLHFETVTGIIRTLTYYNEIPEVLVVGISYDQTSLDYETRRTSDLTPTVFRSKGGSAKQFLDFIKNQLVPFIETSFRTLEDNRIYVGHSFGALFGSYVLFHEPGVFQKYVLLSPSYWWGDKISFEYEKKYSKENDSLNATVYLCVGEYEKRHTMIAHWKEMTETLQSRKYKGFLLKSELIPQETHISVVSAGFSRGIRFVLLNSF